MSVPKRRSRVTFTVGAPGSGKTTWAREQVAANPEKVRRLNLDDIRRTLTGSDDSPGWSSDSEKVAQQVMLGAFRKLIAAGYDVIVDNTHVRPRIPRLVRAEFGDQLDYAFQDFRHVSIQECHSRVLDRVQNGGHDVPIEVIARMHAHQRGLDLDALTAEFNRSDGLVPYEPDPSLPKAVLVDIDGTLALHGDRNPYDTSRYAEDTLEHRLSDLIHTLAAWNFRIVVMSGRDAGYRAVTEKWLRDNEVYFDELHMRTESDTRRDDTVKLELFNEHVRHRFNVIATFDDRDRVVHFWRRLGLLTLQCAYGDF